MITDLEIIRLIATLHGDADPAPQGSVPLPSHIEIIANPLVTVGIVREPGHDTIIFPGSRTFLDWYSDLDAIAVSMGRLGLVHAGFMAAPLLVKAKLDAAVGASVSIAGHSLGAAHALDYAALRLMEGKAVAEIVTFGCPMAGCGPLRDFLSGIPMRNYRNNADPVPTVPRPWFGFPCVQARAFTALHGAADPGDESAFHDHHAVCYFRGLS